MINPRMIFTLFIVLSVSFFAYNPLGIAAENNLIVNSSFEDLNEIGAPAPFRFIRYAGDSQSVVDNTVARTGNHSVRLDGDGQTRTSVEYRLTGIEGDVTYKVSVWYRHAAEDQGIQVGITQLRLMAFQGGTKIPWEIDWIPDRLEGDYQVRNGENLHVLAWRDAPDEWVELTVTFSLPQNANALYIEAFNARGEGTVWFDDVSVTKLDAS